MGVLAHLFGRQSPVPDQTDGGTAHAVADGGARNDHSHPEDPSVGSDNPDVVAELVDRLRNDDLSEDQRATLRRELGGVPRSHEVKFQHLQARVADFAAYSDAIEEFIDTNGTARDVVAELDEIEDRLQGRVRSLEDDLDAAAAARSDLSDRLDELASRVDTLETLEDDLASVDSRLEDLADTHDSDIADLATAREDAVDELEASHTADVAELEDTIADVSDGLRRELAELQAETEDLEERWNRLEGVLTAR